MTAASLKLLRLMASDPEAERYGLDLAKKSGVQHGTTYPILKRLLAAGWLESRPEEVDPAEAGRPRQRLYRLTALGERETLRVLAEHYVALPDTRRHMPDRPGAWAPVPRSVPT